VKAGLTFFANQASCSSITLAGVLMLLLTCTYQGVISRTARSRFSARWKKIPRLSPSPSL